MAGIIEKFGAYIGKISENKPLKARKLLVTGFKAFGIKLDHFPDKRLPKSRQYIASLLNDVVVEMLKHPEKAALTSILTPTELLYAADIHPLCAELYSAFINGAHAEGAFVEAAEAKGVAETFCSYHKVLLGSAYRGVFPKPKFIVNTSLICDANNLTFRELAKLYNIDQFYIDVPHEDSEESIMYVADQLRDLKVFIEDQTHSKITDERLRETIMKSKATINNLIAAQPYKRDKYFAGDLASELYELYITHIGLGTKEAQRYSEMVLKDLEMAPSRRGKRILWVHTIPNWQPPIRDMFNYSEKAQILACDMNFECLYDMDPDKPYESMARRICSSTFNGDGSRRINAAKEMAEKLDADGVIIFCHWGCKQTMGLSATFKREMEKAGFPTLVLNGDGCDERNSSNGQVSTRLKAFMEMLEGMK